MTLKDVILNAITTHKYYKYLMSCDEVSSNFKELEEIIDVAVVSKDNKVMMSADNKVFVTL